MIFPEGLHSAEEFEQVGKALKGYGKKGGPFLLANMTEFGKTPYIHVEDFSKWGYNIVIYPVSTLRIANQAVFINLLFFSLKLFQIDNFLKDLKSNGS